LGNRAGNLGKLFVMCGWNGLKGRWVQGTLCDGVAS
jgi:hypothetical protein